MLLLCKVWNEKFGIFNVTLNCILSICFWYTLPRLLIRYWRNQICLRTDYFAEDPDINSSLLVKNTSDAVPCHSGFHPLSSAIFWHVHLMQHMCVCTTLGLSVWDFVCDLFWLCRPTAWHSSSVCVFSLLMRPLMIREGSVTHIHTHKHKARPNTVAPGAGPAHILS